MKIKYYFFLWVAFTGTKAIAQKKQIQQFGDVFTRVNFAPPSSKPSCGDSIFYPTLVQKNVAYKRKPQLIYLNLWGEGNLLSINYDRRFKNQLDGWGWHVGIGGIVLPDYNFTEINLPVGVNYLMGNKGNYLELGINESVVFDKLSQPEGGEAEITSLYGVNIHGTNSLWSLTSGTIGYRRQPKNSGFCFRVGILPFITYIDGKLEKPIQSPTGYMSFGYKF